jgi:hypothetical protein
MIPVIFKAENRFVKEDRNNKQSIRRQKDLGAVRNAKPSCASFARIPPESVVRALQDAVAEESAINNYQRTIERPSKTVFEKVDN